jgi:cell division septum initiation protein DivIVA
MKKLDADSAKALKAALKSRTRPELKKAFALIRAHEDRTLLAAVLPAKKRAAKRKGDPLVRELEQTLKPIMGPAQEKADLLIEHIAKKHRRKLGFQPKGLADATRQLRTKFSDQQISAGAKSLVTHLAKLYGDSETVV